MARRLSAPVRRFAAYAWGNGDCGQLGLPRTALQEEVDTFGALSTRPTAIPLLRRYQVLAAAGSFGHSAFVRADGTLFTMGLGTSGQLGEGETDEESGVREVRGLPRVIDVACGSRHTLVLTEEGVVYGFGEGGMGQLGGDGGVVEGLLRGGHRIVGVGAGDDFSVAVCEEGSVYTWGHGGQGRLGHGRIIGGGVVRFLVGEGGSWGDGVEWGPRKVRGLQGVRVAKVFVGKHHVVAVDKEGRAFVWGSGRHFQLGNGEEGDVYEPVEGFTGLGKVERVAIGGTHSLVLTRGGRVYAVGMNGHGCLGLGYEQSVGMVKEAVQIGVVGFAVDVAAGWCVSGAVVCEKGRGTKGEVVMWGCGGAGALGNGDVVDHWAPVRIGLRARRVVIGSGASSVLAFD